MLPPPPSPGSMEFLLDEYYYQKCKLERDTPRGQEAILDAHIDGDTILSRFTEAFGMEITPESLPELYKLLMWSKESFGSVTTAEAKEKYNRIRPFVYYNESTSTPEDEPFLRSNGSYPSGHAAIYWGLGLILQEIEPERQEILMRRGYEGGRSRCIVGAHWWSDIEAGRLLASATYARLHADIAFNEQVEKAKREYFNETIEIQYRKTRVMMKELEVLLGDGMQVKQLPFDEDEKGYRIAFVMTSPELEGVDKVILWHRATGKILTIKALVSHRQETPPYGMLTALVTDGKREGELYIHELHSTLREFLDGDDKTFKNLTNITWKSVKGMKYKAFPDGRISILEK